ncbi:MAG: histidyl-tRNA synthetase [Planctomycetota bacterium]|jgi:histidyl-tRNA synthetase
MSDGKEQKRSFRAPRGLRDVLPEEIGVWNRLEQVARDLAGRRGFREIRTPLLEETELFKRSVGEVTDIVEKEMFTMERGEHSFTLRPEGTAGIARAYLQAGYAKRAPVQKLFLMGPMFRYERPQKGRERQFTQFDVELLGSLDPRADAEVMHLAASFFEELGLEGLELRMNSMGDGDDRDRYRDAVREFLAPKMEAHCELCQSRFTRNVLRVLDCKVPACQELQVGAPVILEFLSEENREHFDQVQSHLRAIGRTVVVDPSIVRGLDYYTRTVFEVHYPALGARSALCGGGRYDHLLSDLGGPDLPAVGFAIGFTGTLIVLEELGLKAGLVEAVPEVFVASADDVGRGEVFKVAEELRAAGIGAVFDMESRSMKAQMKIAGKAGHRLAVIVGSDEVERGVVMLKQLEAREQGEVERTNLVASVQQALRAESE